MKKTVLEITWVASIVSIMILSSCNTTKQTETETEMETAETPTTTETPMTTDSTNMDMNNMGTDSIRAVE
jgi:hypothetical protein